MKSGELEKRTERREEAEKALKKPKKLEMQKRWTSKIDVLLK